MKETFTAAAGERSSGTIPLKILNAAEACQAGRQRRDDSPIDILAVVVNIETCKKLVRIWIHDSSLPRGLRAQILILGKKKLDFLVDELAIRRGDIIRFNRVDLRKDQDETGTPNVLIFWHSIHDLEAGAAFFRLGHINGRTEQVDTNVEDIVPESMRTNQSRLNELILWYQGSDWFTAQTAALPRLPCQRRSLAEFQSSVGVVGHVVAHVVDIELDAAVIRRGKRKISNAESTAFIFWVTLTDDDCATLVTFLLDSSTSKYGRFLEFIQQAQAQKRPVRLSRVVTKFASQLHTTTLRTDDVILIRTADSDIALAKHDETGQNMLRMMKLSPEKQGQKSMGNCGQDDKVILERWLHIVDINVNEVSLSQQTTYLDSNESSMNLNRLFQSEERDESVVSYSSAVISFCDPELGDICVEADGAILKILCGGLELDNWSPSQKRREPLSHFSNQLVLDMIQGLLTEKVVLRWEIEKIIAAQSGRTRLRVIDVSLPEL